MNVLVLDSATPAVTTALVRLGAGPPQLLAHRRTVDARGHGELLAPQVEEVLAEAGRRPRELAAVVAGTGPGPFTGLRVGLVTAAALSQALAIPAYGVCSLDALGGSAGRGVVLVATDARRQEVYWAVYRDGVRVAGPAVAPPAAVAEQAAALGASLAVGDGAHRYAGVLGLPVRPEPRYPPPLALAALAADRIRAGAPPDPLTPLYLRRPDAREPGARKPVLR